MTRVCVSVHAGGGIPRPGPSSRPGGGGGEQLEQHSVYLIRGGRYASCIHTGGPSFLFRNACKFLYFQTLYVPSFLLSKTMFSRRISRFNNLVGPAKDHCVKRSLLFLCVFLLLTTRGVAEKRIFSRVCSGKGLHIPLMHWDRQEEAFRRNLDGDQTGRTFPPPRKPDGIGPWSVCLEIFMEGRLCFQYLFTKIN